IEYGGTGGSPGGLVEQDTLQFRPSNTARLSISSVTFTGLSNADMGSNSCLGVGCLYQISRTAAGTGINNTAAGLGSMRQHTIGKNSTCVGTQCLAQNGDGNNNTALGMNAGQLGNHGSGNVFLGYSAGYYETGSNKLFIDDLQRANEADARAKALIYGVFDPSTANQSVTVNGSIASSTGNIQTKTNQLQSFSFRITNSGGTLQHQIMGDAISWSGASNYAGKITGASATLANTPSIGAGVDFTSGAGIEAGLTNTIDFNTAAQNAGDMVGVPVISFNSAGTDVDVSVGIRSINVNGSTVARLAFSFFN